MSFIGISFRSLILSLPYLVSLNLCSIFFNSVILLFCSLTSVRYFLIFPICLLKLSLCSSILPSSMNIFITVIIIIMFWLHSRHVEILRLGIKPASQQWHRWIPMPLSHQETPKVYLFWWNDCLFIPVPWSCPAYCSFPWRVSLFFSFWCRTTVP